MCRIWEEVREEGREEGREEMLIENAVNLKEYGLSVEAIAKAMKTTV